MALVVLQPGAQPLGQFDGRDADYLTLKGGEVVTLIGATVGTDTGAADSADGYTGTTTKTRPVVTKSLSTSAGTGPLWLCDDGTTGYGTLFGSVVGGVAGAVTSGAALGPHTATGSGKVTCWANPGLFAVTLDACDTTASTGLQPTNSTLAVGAALYATPSGLLTPDATAGTACGGKVVGRFCEFTTGMSKVTTPLNLVASLNSPTSDVGAAAYNKFTQAVFYFYGG